MTSTYGVDGVKLGCVYGDQYSVFVLENSSCWFFDCGDFEAALSGLGANFAGSRYLKRLKNGWRQVNLAVLADFQDCFHELGIVQKESLFNSKPLENWRV